MEDDEIIAETDEEKDDGKERSISSDLIRGHINTIILRALYDGDKYGYEIISEIEQKSRGQYSLKQPSLYSALKRLEKDGYITSYWGGSVSGGRRKYFSLTDAGKAVSEQNQSEWEYSRTIIDSLISDKDFDFNNPAPTAVDMRMLKRTTSRVPAGESDEEEEFAPIFNDAGDREKLQEEFDRKNNELTEEFDRKNSELQQEFERKNSELEQERALFEEEKRLHEEEKRLRDEEAQKEREAYEEALRTQREEHENELQAQKEANEELIRTRLAGTESELLYRDRIIEEERKHIEDIRAAQAEESAARLACEQGIKERDARLAAERERYESQLLEEQSRHERELLEREARVRVEMEEEFRRRQQELLHQNYINLVSAPPQPAPREQSEYTYYSVPAPAAADEAPTPEPVAPAEPETDYRSVVHHIYSGAVQSTRDNPPRAQSLDGIDFSDLEARAAQDNIRITTSGGKRENGEESGTANIVHRGKALFLSAIVVFFYCIALGSVALALQKKLPLPLFHPYFIWGAGLAVLLITGLAYANHYGERSLRRSGPVLINAIVAFALLVIATLILALGIKIDFTDISQLSTYVLFPILFFFGVIIFGIAYFLQVRPSK